MQIPSNKANCTRLSFIKSFKCFSFCFHVNDNYDEILYYHYNKISRSSALIHCRVLIFRIYLSYYPELSSDIQFSKIGPCTSTSLTLFWANYSLYSIKCTNSITPLALSKLTILQVRNWFQKLAPSSKLNKTPPIGSRKSYYKR